MSNVKAQSSKLNVVYQQRPYNVVIPDWIRNPVFSIWIPAFAGMTKMWDQGFFRSLLVIK
jgi:hypothetical protein